MTVEFDDLVKELEELIKKKHETNQSQDIDGELLAWVSVYKNGSKVYSRQAKKHLKSFFVNAGFVKGIRSIGG